MNIHLSVKEMDSLFPMSCTSCILQLFIVLNGVVPHLLLFEIRIWPPFISVLLGVEQVHKIFCTWGKIKTLHPKAAFHRRFG